MTTTQEDHQKQLPIDEINHKLEKLNVSLSIWPPTQRTRDAVINRLTQTLSTPSVLSKRYGSLSPDEASSAARSIEEEAFDIANSTAATTTAGDDGFETLQIYSKEISKRMLEAVKSRAAPSSRSPSEEISSSSL